MATNTTLYNAFKKVKRQGNYRRTIKSRVDKILNKNNKPQSIVSVHSDIGKRTPNNMDIVTPQFQSEAEFQSEDEIELNHIMFNDSDDESEINFETNIENTENDYLDIQQVFRARLSKWAISVNANHHQVRELLAVCNETLPFKLPVDPRTIFRTPNSVCVQEIAGGQYWHRGMIEWLNLKLQNVSCLPSQISLNINIDGLPISESSNQQFWPILFNIHELHHIVPGVIGIFYGKSKCLIVSE